MSEERRERVRVTNTKTLDRDAMDICLSDAELADENRRFARSGGVSENNRDAGFVPAYRDGDSGRVVLSKTADGSIATVHTLEGLPDEWIATHDETGRAASLKSGIVSGFYRNGEFFTREEAAAEVQQPNCR